MFKTVGKKRELSLSEDLFHLLVQLNDRCERQAKRKPHGLYHRIETQ